MTRPTEQKRAQEAGTHSQRDTHDQEKTDRSRERDSESPSDSWISRKALVARLTPTASLATRVQQTQAREWLIKWSSMSECELLARLRERERTYQKTRPRFPSLVALLASLSLTRSGEEAGSRAWIQRLRSFITRSDRRPTARERERERETTGERDDCRED